MTYKNWERELKKQLKKLPKAERARMIDYYREMYYDRLSLGAAEASIVEEFGDPKECVAKFSYEPAFSGVEEEQTSKRGKRKRFSAAEIVGAVFFTVLLVIPLIAILVSIVASFGAVCLSGAAVAVCGVVFAMCYPFTGVSGFALLSGIGLGILSSGTGLLLFVGFLYATKGSSILFYRAIKAVYTRR